MRLWRLITAIPCWIWGGVRRGDRRCEWCVYCLNEDAIIGRCLKKNFDVVNLKND